MKKISKKSTALLLILCMMLVSCGIPQGKGSDQSEVYNDSLIEDLSFKGDFIEDGDTGATIPYDYNIPQIISDNKEVQEFNEHLMEIVQSAQNSHYLYYDDISWSSFWNGSLLGLVLEMRFPFSEEREYMTCSYDFKEDAFLSNEDLISRAGMTEKKFEKELRRTVAEKFDSDNENLLREYRNCGEDLLDFRARTISDSNLNPDSIPLYMDSEGHLCAAVMFSTPAGGGIYSCIVPVATGRDTIHKKADCGPVTAELRENGVTLVFSDKDDTPGAIPKDSLLKYGRKYKVHGLYGTYTDMVLSYMGNDGSLYLCLLDDQGRITVCNIMNGIASGAVFTAIGPLYAPEDITSIHSASDQYGHSIYAVDQDGGETDLYGYIAEAEKQLHPLMRNSSWAYYNGDYWLNIEYPGRSLLSWYSAGGMFAEGELYYMGMTDKGMVYGFRLDGSKGSMSGTLTIECHTPYYAPEGDNILTLKQYTGPMLPGVPQHGILEMVRCWG